LNDLCNGPFVHIRLFVYSLIVPLIRTDKLDGWGVTALVGEPCLTFLDW